MAWPTISISGAHIPDALRHLGNDFDKLYDPALDEISKGITRTYQSQIMAVGAVLSGWFIGHVRQLRTGHRYRVVGAGPEVNYSAVVEHGWIERARGQASYPGRWPAARAIGMISPIIEDAFNHQMWRI